MKKLFFFAQSGFSLTVLWYGVYTVEHYIVCAKCNTTSCVAGRTYLAGNQDLFKGLMDNLRSEDRDSITREMVLGALQKLSLRWVDMHILFFNSCINNPFVRPSEMMSIT